jgi:seryl-tRNA synthetase
MERPAEVYFHLELDPGADSDRIATLIRERLSQLEAVEETYVEPDDESARITGAEIVAGIALTVTLVRGSKNLAAELKTLIEAMTEVVQSLTGLKHAVVELAGRNVPVEEVDDSSVEELAAEV